MRFPRKLKDGDKILLTSFSSTSITPTELEPKIERFERENSLDLIIDKSLLGTRGRHENLSKFRQKVTSSFNNLDLHDIGALFSIRGGWSSTDVLLNNKVDIDNLVQKILDKKAIVLGYSDNTLLSDYINLAYGYVTYHSPNFEGLYNWSQKSQELLIKMLKQSVEVSIPLKPLTNGKTSHYEEGYLISSNLECLTLSLAFTDNIHREYKEKGVILLLEDIYLEPSLAFRYLEVVLMRFKNEGIKVNAIIFGKFAFCIEHSYASWEGKTFKEVLPHLLQYVDISVFETDKVGHIESEDALNELSLSKTSIQVPETANKEGDEVELAEDYYTTPSGSFVKIKENELLYTL